MKILWLSENTFSGKIPRDFPQMRTEFAWFVASDGDHKNFGELPTITEKYDVAIVILPKREDLLKGLYQQKLLSHLRRVANQIGWMQEGPATYFQDYSVATQVWWYSTLNSMDFLMVHNKYDAKYFGGLFNQPIFVNSSLMIEDAIDKRSLKKSKRHGVIIGGNFVSWYGGFDSYMIATIFDQPIYAPSMGRKQQNESHIDGLTHLDYMTWTNWISRLSSFKYGVHLMPTHAAGTFALNCSYLGIPCIGYRGLDTQEILHPHTTVDLRDIKAARFIADNLKNNEDYYTELSQKTKQLYKENYTEIYWQKKFFSFLKSLKTES